MMGMASLVALAIVCLLLMKPLKNKSLESSARIAELSASSVGEALAVSINGVADVVRAYSGVIAEVVDSEIVPNEKKRAYLLRSMDMLLQNDEKLNNLWCMFEPDALDGLDSLFVNHTGSNSRGVFAPLFANGTSIVRESLGEAEIYYLPKKTKREMVSKPYMAEINGKKTNVISVVIPIMLGDRFIGVAGSDFEIEALYRAMAGFNGNTAGKLVTGEGIIAVHRNPEQIGLLAEAGNPEIINRLADGKLFKGFYNFEGQDIFKVYVPVLLGDGNATWYYSVDIPRAEINAKIRESVVLLILGCLLGVALITFAGWLLTRAMISNILNITGIIRKLSLGHIHLQIDGDKGQDEIGTMKNELGQFVNGLKETADFAHGIGKGNLNAEFRPLSDNDELGNALLEMRQSLLQAAEEHSLREKEEKQRNWSTEGLAKFAEILRADNDNLDDLSYNVISNIVKYLGANQGGIFVLNDAENEADRFLEMKACYAFDRKKFTDKQIRIGEGLIGTCYLEGEPIYMTEIPNEYVTITSGLGDANPSALLICPLKVNSEIFGVMELASFRKFEPYQLEFVEKVSESIAATISSVKVNIRTSRLLDQTKLQAEEMANAEEELRQNMEEMQATQEEMRRREIELNETLNNMRELQEISEVNKHEIEQFQNAIYETSNVVEFSPDGTLIDINPKLLALIGAGSKADFVGKNLSVFVGESEALAVMASINQGKIYENTQYVNTGVGVVKNFIQRFVPICDKCGNLRKIMMMTFADDTPELQKALEENESQLTQLSETLKNVRELQEISDENKHEIEQFQEGIFQTCSVVELSPEAIITKVNKNITDIFGMDRSAFIDKHLSVFVGNEAFESAWKNVKNGKIHEDVQKVSVGERIKTIIQRFVPVCDKEGTLKKVLLLAFLDEKDELQNVLQASQKSEKKFEDKMHWYESLLESFTLPITATDLEGRITYANKAALEMVNGKMEDFIGKPCSELWNVSICHTEGCSINRLRRGIDKTTFSKGDQKFEALGCFLTDKDGNKIGHFEIINNITEAVNREEQINLQVKKLNELKQLQDMFLETLNIVEFSPDGVITDINQSLLNIWEADRSVFVGKHYAKLAGDEAFKTVWDDMVQGKQHADVRTITTMTGKSMVFRHNFMPVCNKQGELLRVVLIAFHEKDAEKEVA
jgi:PAS domain S-box-containing protein